MDPLVSPPWCADEPARCVYQGRIRDAKFGSQTSAGFRVGELSRFRLGFLHPFPRIEYADDTYRTAVNDSASVEQYFKLHADQQPGYLQLFRDVLQTGFTVADFGCGGGALLDLVRQTTRARTIAIEPFVGYHASLRSRGHEVFSSGDEAARACRTSVDVALSFHVIEHVEDPVAYLQSIRACVRPGGLAVVLTPNWDDILMGLDPERMAPFFYRRVHNYYFTSAALQWVGRLAGWSTVREIFYHEFGLANSLQWLRDGRPAGHTRLPQVDAEADAFWQSYLERTKQANNVGVLLRND
jgi:2-polyprenyl-3-methyl-5-hydroxy-6-metoxy-1,4-benzoquinol methylase